MWPFMHRAGLPRMEAGVGAVPAAAWTEPVCASSFCGERAGPGRVERPGGKTASPGPAFGGSGGVLTAELPAAELVPFAVSQVFPPDALPGLTRPRLSFPSALAELSPGAMAGVGHPPVIYLDRSLANLG